ncbi:zinc-finger homeodomain protein 11-like [Rutidosis leptorrhynchoides]|uniref:zinc-finger homeodomain protein 11-like n=1 Tax=Rutidosis leptorrhynchoides TaxID=125765 RepID=UPI003A99EE84
MEDIKHPITKIPNPNYENETPPIKLLHGNTHTHLHQPPPHTAVTYKECLKNHAAGIGGHALDGCGEFMLSPTSFTCAACGCHRNFHRREQPTTVIPTATRPHSIDFHRHRQTSTSTSSSPPSPPPTNYAYGHHHLLLSLNTAADQNHTVATPGTPVAIKISGRKRFRTKFSQDQKDKMMGFAVKIGWKIQRCDDKMIIDFCNDIGIRRSVFKVWMHNNKNTFAKKETNATAATTAATTAAGVKTDLVISNDSSNQHNDGHLQDSSDGSSE